MSPIMNVAISGASGYLGKVILQTLLADGSFNVTVLRRPSSTSTFPADVKVVDVDHESIPDLTAALTGQDALIMTTGSLSLLSQIPLIEAAAAAGVYRIIPSNFGSDIANPNVRKLEFFADKIAVETKVHEVAADATNNVTYTHIHNAAFIPYSLEGFLFDVKKPFVIDSGDIVFSATTLENIGNAVLGVLRHPQETENKTLRIEDFKLTQNKLFQIAKQVDPSWSPEPQRLNLVELNAETKRRRAEGIQDRGTIVSDLWTSLLDPDSGANFQQVDNELLGLQPKSEDVIVDHLKRILKQ